MPTARFSHESSTSRAIDDVWLRLQKADTWASIGPVERVWDPVHDDAGQLMSYRWSTTVGPTKYRGRAKVVEAVPPVTMRLNLDGGEIAGVLTTAMEENGDGTQLRVTLKITSKGPLSSMFFPLISEVVERGLPEQVERFVNSFES